MRWWWWLAVASGFPWLPLVAGAGRRTGRCLASRFGAFRFSASRRLSLNFLEAGTAAHKIRSLFILLLGAMHEWALINCAEHAVCLHTLRHGGGGCSLPPSQSSSFFCARPCIYTDVLASLPSQMAVTSTTARSLNRLRSTRLMPGLRCRPSLLLRHVVHRGPARPKKKKKIAMNQPIYRHHRYTNAAGQDFFASQPSSKPTVLKIACHLPLHRRPARTRQGRSFLCRPLPHASAASFAPTWPSPRPLAKAC